MKRPTEVQAARIEAKIERLRADATAALRRDQFARADALNVEADRLWDQYVAACGVSEIVRRQLAASLAKH